MTIQWLFMYFSIQTISGIGEIFFHPSNWSHVKKRFCLAAIKYISDRQIDFGKKHPRSIQCLQSNSFPLGSHGKFVQWEAFLYFRSTQNKIVCKGLLKEWSWIDWDQSNLLFLVFFQFSTIVLCHVQPPSISEKKTNTFNEVPSNAVKLFSGFWYK